MRIILGIAVLLIIVFILVPHEVYRIVDLVNSDAQKFKPTVLERLVFSDKNEVRNNFMVKRSGYYELGVILNDRHIRVDSVEKQFNGDVLFEVYSNNDDLVFTENVIRPKYFKPLDDDIDFVKKVALITVPLNTFKNGKEYYMSKLKYPLKMIF